MVNPPIAANRWPVERKLYKYIATKYGPHEGFKLGCIDQRKPNVKSLRPPMADTLPNNATMYGQHRSKGRDSTLASSTCLKLYCLGNVFNFIEHSPPLELYCSWE